MEYKVGDTVELRKKHPCGSYSFELLRVGMDFRLRCVGCGRELLLSRQKAEKMIKKRISGGS